MHTTPPHTVQGFAPTAIGPHIKQLILGSAPSVASLQKQQYYGHPQNHFWRIMGELYNAGLELPYPARVQILTDHGIAIWDVLANCERPGSLDSAITADSIVVNDFANYFSQSPNLTNIILNGRYSEKTYRKYVTTPANITTTYCPSTSPANASIPYQTKRQQWQTTLL